jgi:hypothetical protein
MIFPFFVQKRVFSGADMGLKWAKKGDIMGKTIQKTEKKTTPKTIQKMLYGKSKDGKPLILLKWYTEAICEGDVPMWYC